KIGEASSHRRGDSTRKKNQSGKKTRLLIGETASFFEIRRQPREVEIERITDAKVHQADQQQSGIEELAPLDPGSMLLDGPLANDRQLFARRTGVIARIVAIPPPPENTPDHS